VAPKTTETRTAISAWVPTSLALELQARAAQADRTLSAELRRAVKAHLERDGANR
jgi:hypothetical protein